MRSGLPSRSTRSRASLCSGVNPAVLSRTSRLIKRGFDLLVAGLLLLGLPVLVVAAVAIKLDSRGPVLFRQERVGKGGTPFRLLKLRTMVVDAERMRGELLGESRDDELAAPRERIRGSPESGGFCGWRASTSFRSCGT